MEKHNFRMLGADEFRLRMRNKHLRAPRKRPGREIGFIYEANGLEVWVWTSWLMEENKIRDADRGWVLITEEGVSKYFSRYTRRTKFFFTRLLRRAWITGWRVENLARCKACDRTYTIVRGPHLGQRYFKRFCYCIRTKENPRTLPWNHNKHLMPAEAQEFVDAEEKSKRHTAKERKKTEKATGKKVVPERLTRRTWKSNEY
jgi:hypothetical protein